MHMSIQKVLPSNNERLCLVTKSHLLTSWPAQPRVSSNFPRKNGENAVRPRCSCKEACNAGSGAPWPARARQLRHYVRRQVVSSDAAEPHPHAHAAEAASVKAWLHAFYKFTRPHTMAGTAISVLSISLLALQSPQAVKLEAVDMSVAAGAVFQALSAALLANIAVVGLNQLTDIEIDKINKPSLPLASGEFTVQTGAAIVIATALASLMVGWWSGSRPLISTLLVSLVLGVVYSTDLPFLRWKRFPVLAAGCIVMVRALAVQLGFFLHMLHALDPLHAHLHAQALTPALKFTMGFMALFALVIALLKDAPDSAGDSRAGVRTLTVRVGATRVFWACMWILTAAYGGACLYSIWAACMAPNTASLVTRTVATTDSMGLTGAASKVVGVVVTRSSGAAAGAVVVGQGVRGVWARTVAAVSGHVVMAAMLWRRALEVDTQNPHDLTRCYMFVWRLFYAEYILIPLLM